MITAAGPTSRGEEGARSRRVTYVGPAPLYRVTRASPLLVLLAFGLALLGCASPPPRAASANATTAVPTAKEVRRTLLRRHEVKELPGWETRLYLIEYPPGASAPPHLHPAAGLGYVIEGAFESTFEGEAPTRTEQGESFVDAADKVHTLFRNASAEKPLRFVVGYTIRIGEPPLVPIDPARPTAR
jgi:quercetin dioxygenase-like cupin family protein